MSIFPNGPPPPEGWPSDEHVQFTKYGLDTWIASHPEHAALILDEQDSPPAWRPLTQEEFFIIGKAMTFRP